MFHNLKSNQINITFLISISQWLTLCNVMQKQFMENVFTSQLTVPLLLDQIQIK